jgi:transposase-like protein
MEKIKKHLAAQARSGETISVYCRRAGISAKTFYNWRRRVKDVGKFVEVGRSEDAGLELKVREGLSVIVPAKFDAAHLKQLLQVLGC